MAEVTSALKLEAVCRYAASTPRGVVTRKESLPESLQTEIVGTSFRKPLTVVMSRVLSVPLPTENIHLEMGTYSTSHLGVLWSGGLRGWYVLKTARELRIAYSQDCPLN
jgi:hypothetical protein